MSIDCTIEIAGAYCIDILSNGLLDRSCCYGVKLMIFLAHVKQQKIIFILIWKGFRGGFQKQRWVFYDLVTKKSLSFRFLDGGGSNFDRPQLSLPGYV